MLTKKGKLLLGALLPLAIILFGVIYNFFLKPDPPLENKFVTQESAIRGDAPPQNNSEVSDQPEITVQLPSPPAAYSLSPAAHTYQTFNNCGPATLSMFLSYFDIGADQKTLGEQMRPFQNPTGDNDDKTIFPSEFTNWALTYGRSQGLNVYYRPNGSLELLKNLLSQDVPVVAKTWLNLKEDIGHFIIVRGYDDTKQIITVDDSYYGPNKKYSYYDFLSLWQPFNYSYIIGFENDKQAVIEQILGPELSEETAWQNAVSRALKEHELVPDNIYPLYNLAVGYYHIGDYKNSLKYFEEVEDRLPRRMMWYQIEPIKSYVAVKNYRRVFELIEKILEDGNRAFSELYYIRGQIYLEQGEPEKARHEFEQAIEYNSGYQEAVEAINAL